MFNTTTIKVPMRTARRSTVLATAICASAVGIPASALAAGAPEGPPSGPPPVTELPSFAPPSAPAEPDKSGHEVAPEPAGTATPAAPSAPQAASAPQVGPAIQTPAPAVSESASLAPSAALGAASVRMHGSHITLPLMCNVSGRGSLVEGSRAFASFRFRCNGSNAKVNITFTPSQTRALSRHNKTTLSVALRPEGAHQIRFRFTLLTPTHRASSAAFLTAGATECGGSNLPPGMVQPEITDSTQDYVITQEWIANYGLPFVALGWGSWSNVGPDIFTDLGPGSSLWGNVPHGDWIYGLLEIVFYNGGNYIVEWQWEPGVENVYLGNPTGNGWCYIR